jgi:hypothetical protein
LLLPAESGNGSVKRLQKICHASRDEMEADFLLSGTFPNVICVVVSVQIENQMKWTRIHPSP